MNIFYKCINESNQILLPWDRRTAHTCGIPSPHRSPLWLGPYYLSFPWFFSIANTYKSTWVCLYAKPHQISPKANIKRVEKKSAKDKAISLMDPKSLSTTLTLLYPPCLYEGWNKKKTEETPLNFALAELSIIKYGDRGREGRVMMEALASPLFKYQYLF